MRKLIFEKDYPSGEVLINIPELEILKWLPYITNFTFHEKDVYEEKIKLIEKENPNKILIIVNDNSNHGFVKRCFIQVYDKEHLKTNNNRNSLDIIDSEIY